MRAGTVAGAMKAMWLTGVLIALVLVSGCAIDSPTATVYGHDEPVQVRLSEVRFTGSGDEVRLLAANTGNTARTYQVPVSSGSDAIWRLYFSIANTSNGRVVTPKVSVLAAPASMRSGTAIRTSAPPISADGSRFAALSESGTEHGRRLPAVERVHANLSPPPSLRLRGAGDASEPLLRIAAAPNNSVNDQMTFNIETIAANEPTTLQATARYVRQVGTQRVVFWTPDSVYTGCTAGCLPADGLLTQADVVIIADAFLRAGDNNDIYDLMQSIFGTHWGRHPYDGRLVSADHINQIDFLLYNIGNRTANRVYDSGVLGYYWSGNNYIKQTGESGAILRSNERLLLAIHAPWYKVSRAYLTDLRHTTDSQNRIIARFRQTVLMTLVHEYQHLIQFYQRLVIDGVDALPDSTWLNEQFSLMAEDLLYRHVAGSTADVIDHRGLSGASAGSYGVCDGLIPTYLSAYGSRGIAQWQQRIWNYGINYSFGAYLLRNYGGVDFVRSAYSTTDKDAAAITYALRQRTRDNTLTMGEAVRRWGAAVLLSDQTSVPSRYKVNNSTTYFTSRHNGIDYDLGSINYYNYASSCARNANGALRVFNTTESVRNTLNSTHDGYAAIPIAVAENLNGIAQFKVTLSPGQTLTAVSKRNQTRDNPVFY